MSPLRPMRFALPARRTRYPPGAAAALALAALAAVGWLYLLMGAGVEMPATEAMAMAGPAAWSAGYAVTVLSMWMVMMAAMMLPSAAPMILLYRAIAHKRHAAGRARVRTAAFIGAYLLVWIAFSIAATGGQWAFRSAGLLDASMAIDSNLLGAGLLLAAGLYQLSPLKWACLRQCRAPLTFLGRNWRDDAAGTLRLGLSHGLYCVGCCWALMALLFVGGVMNMLWIAGLTLFVLLEKVVPHGRVFARIAGGALIAAGGLLLAM